THQADDDHITAIDTGLAMRGFLHDRDPGYNPKGAYALSRSMAGIGPRANCDAPSQCLSREAAPEAPDLPLLPVKSLFWGNRMTNLTLAAKVALLPSLLGLAAGISGCASNIKQMEEVQATGGTPFTQA